MNVETTRVGEHLRELELPVQEALAGGDLLDDVEPGEAVLGFALVHAHEAWQGGFVVLQCVQGVEAVDQRLFRDVATAQHGFEKVQPVVKILERYHPTTFSTLRLPIRGPGSDPRRTGGDCEPGVFDARRLSGGHFRTRAGNLAGCRRRPQDFRDRLF